MATLSFLMQFLIATVDHFLMCESEIRISSLGRKVFERLLFRWIQVV